MWCCGSVSGANKTYCVDLTLHLCLFKTFCILFNGECAIHFHWTYIILRTNLVDAEVKIMIYFSFARPLWSTHGRGSGCWRWKCVNYYGVTGGNIYLWSSVDIQSKATLTSQRTEECYKIRFTNLNVLIRNIKKYFHHMIHFLHANYNWNNYPANKDILVEKPSFSTCSYPRIRFFNQWMLSLKFTTLCRVLKKKRLSIEPVTMGLVTCFQLCNMLLFKLLY